tara:strand:+ start:2104 stop:2301 length:198 start_codon:yes stop_codon:yes gene_type:complete
MTHIMWACIVLLSGEPHSIIDIMKTKEHCESVASLYGKSVQCYPVNVTNHREALEQIKALKIIAK